MKRLLMAALLVAACGDAPRDEPGEADATYIRVFHDDERSVTCWIYAAGYKGGISCIPDADLVR